MKPAGERVDPEEIVRMTDRDQWPAYALGATFAASAVLHVARPAVFRALVPRRLPARQQLVYASGAAEAVCAVGLLTRRPWAGRAAAVLLAGVFPANVQMALDAGSGRHPGAADNRWVAWGRLPLQAPLIWAALRSRPRPR